MRLQEAEEARAERERIHKDSREELRRVERRYEREVAALVERLAQREDDDERRTAAASADRSEAADKDAQMARLQAEVERLQRLQHEWAEEKGGDGRLQSLVAEKERQLGELVRHYDGRMGQWKDAIAAIKEEMRAKVRTSQELIQTLRANEARAHEQRRTSDEAWEARREQWEEERASMHAASAKVTEEMADLRADLDGRDAQHQRETHGLRDDLIALQCALSGLHEQWFVREEQMQQAMQVYEQQIEARDQDAQRSAYQRIFERQEWERERDALLDHERADRDRLQAAVARLQAEVDERLSAWHKHARLQEKADEIARLRRALREMEEARREAERRLDDVTAEVERRRGDEERAAQAEEKLLRMQLRGVEEGGRSTWSVLMSSALLLQVLAVIAFVLGDDVQWHRWADAALQRW